MRDMLAHHYFEIDPAIIWDTITEKLPPLESAIRIFLISVKIPN